MTVVGFNFTKINVEKNELAKGKVNISNNVAITNVESTDLSLGTSKQNGLKMDFSFKTIYEPQIGHVELLGNVLYMADEKKTKEMLATWKKDKKLSPDIMTNVLNTILQRCNIEALLLSKEINLPPPIPLPRVNAKEAEEKKK